MFSMERVQEGAMTRVYLLQHMYEYGDELQYEEIKLDRHLFQQGKGR